MASLSPAERVLVADLRRALAVALTQFAETASARDYVSAERWAAIAFGLVEALPAGADHAP